MGYELTETLYETEAKDGTVVKEDDPRARFLVGVPGQTLSDEEAARLGLGQGKAQADKADADDEDAPAHKAVHQADVADKAVDGPRGKGR